MNPRMMMRDWPQDKASKGKDMAASKKETKGTVQEAPAIAVQEPYNPITAMDEWEKGTLDEQGTVKLFGYLVKTGMAWNLPAMYGLEARRLMEIGQVKEE